MALSAARLPVPGGLSPSYKVIQEGYGARLYLGTVSMDETRQLVAALTMYARLMGFVKDDAAAVLAAQVLGEYRRPQLTTDGTYKEPGQ
ncbi:hypothetical protein [Streptomyces sp. MJM8645]|uniref:hypothetical protein n=1 Tax=Streptomyces sp. MJM8645 TaxID=1120523 RepID=UPI0007AF25AC|nr:hypothetical protein [Streptomyces sp. MJM8645]